MIKHVEFKLQFPRGKNRQIHRLLEDLKRHGGMIYLHIVCFTLSWFSLKSILARIDYLRFASPSPASAGRPYQPVLTPLWLVFLLLPFLRYLSSTNACHVLPVSANAINVKRFKEEFASHTCDKIIACILRFILIASFPPPSRYSLVYRTSVEGPQWVFRDTGFPLFAARDSGFAILQQNHGGIRNWKYAWEVGCQNNPREYGIARNLGSGLRDWKTLLGTLTVVKK